MNKNPNRWTMAFFFALVSLPFVFVWSATQAARVADALLPIYTIAGVGSIDEQPLGLTFRNVTFQKHFACRPDGVLYVSATYNEGGVQGEVLIPAERGGDGKPFFVKNALKPGEAITVPEIRIIASKDLLNRADTVRFVIPCQRPVLGPTHAYSTPVKVR